MRILIIDNNMDEDSWGASDLRRYAVRHPGTTVYVRRGPHDDLPQDLSRVDKIVLSGSRTSCLEEAPWISRLDALVKKALNENKPLLGVCYGHQVLNRVVGGKELMRVGETPEFGWTKIEQVEDSPLFAGLGKSFYTFSSHFEEVASLPKGMKLLARSKDCAIQACQLENRPVFGIQFHPERDLDGAEKTFADRRKKGTPKVLLHPKDSHKLYDPKVGKTIFDNFFKL